MRIEDSTEFRPIIHATDTCACTENVTHLREAFKSCEKREEIAHPHEGELINIPDDRETVDNSPDRRIIPAGKYRVLVTSGSTSSHWMALENLETGANEVATIAYHAKGQMDWRGCTKILIGPPTQPA